MITHKAQLNGLTEKITIQFIRANKSSRMACICVVMKAKQYKFHIFIKLNTFLDYNFCYKEKNTFSNF